MLRETESPKKGIKMVRGAAVLFFGLLSIVFLSSQAMAGSAVNYFNGQQCKAYWSDESDKISTTFYGAYNNSSEDVWIVCPTNNSKMWNLFLDGNKDGLGIAVYGWTPEDPEPETHITVQLYIYNDEADTGMLATGETTTYYGATYTYEFGWAPSDIFGDWEGFNDSVVQCTAYIKLPPSSYLYSYMIYAYDKKSPWRRHRHR